jgi:hypothetical protein
MSLSLPAIPPIMIPVARSASSPTVSEMHERSTLERYEPRLSAAQTLFGSSIAGSRIRIHRIACRTAGSTGSSSGRTTGCSCSSSCGAPAGPTRKPIDYCACALLDQALSASPDRILIAKQLRRASPKLVFISPSERLVLVRLGGRREELLYVLQK